MVKDWVSNGVMGRRAVNLEFNRPVAGSTVVMVPNWTILVNFFSSVVVVVALCDSRDQCGIEHPIYWLEPIYRAKSKQSRISIPISFCAKCMCKMTAQRSSSSNIGPCPNNQRYRRHHRTSWDPCVSSTILCFSLMFFQLFEHIYVVFVAIARRFVRFAVVSLFKTNPTELEQVCKGKRKKKGSMYLQGQMPNLESHLDATSSS